MRWKNGIAMLGIFLTIGCFANEDTKNQNKENFFPAIANADHVHQMLSRVVERNKHHTAHALKLNSSQSIPPISLFDSLLDNLQTATNARLDKISASSEKEIPSVSIDQQIQYLNNLWKGLKATPSTKIVGIYCQKTLDKAKVDVKAASSETAKNAILKDAWERIGQAVFLAERFSREMPALVVLSSLPLSQQRILKRCNQELQKISLDCRDYEELQKETALQDPGLALSFYKPQVIAKILLTSSGKLNLGMISLIRTTFISKDSPLEYETGMDRVLSSMDCSWQAVFDSIVKPLDQNVTSQEVVRATLGLSRKDSLNDLHSKWVALEALLSQLCQGSVGDCFAVAWAIKKHNEYLLESLKDYGELLKCGYLTRMVDGNPDQFFFKNTLADEDLQNTTTLKSSGALGDGDVFLWKAPGIVAACRQMGIDDVQGCAVSAIQVLFHGGHDTIQTTPEEILKCFASFSQQGTHADFQTQFLRGKYGFSLTQNHLLRAWETALAAMAEAKRGDYVRDQVILSVREALKDHWPVWKASLPKELQMLIPQMQSTFETVFNSSNRFVYNAAIPLSHVSSDGSSASGGFELYKRLSNQPFLIGNRIATPDEFKNYLIEVAQMTATKLSQNFSSANQITTLDHLADTLVSYFQGKSFLRNVFYAYDDANKKIADPVEKYRELEKTPMTTLDGDNPYAVVAIDTGISFLTDVRTIRPKNPYDLIKWILDLAQWKEQTQHYLEDANPNELDPATTPQHAFNIAFEEQDVKSFVLSKKSSDQWLFDQAIQPNQAIARATIDNNTKQVFSENMLEWVQQNAQLSNSAVATLHSSIQQINQQQMTLQTYASSFLKMLTSMFQADDDTEKEITLALDAIFLECLPVPILQQLSQRAIRFAKTNWNQGDKNLYFCTFFNPRTALLAFGTIAEDRTDLTVMDEYEWIDQQTWEVDPVEEQAI